MANERLRVNGILTNLTHELVRGWSSLISAKSLQDAFEKTKFVRAGFFLTVSYQSAIESAILALSRIGLFHPDSITFHYLLNVAKENPEAFEHASSELLFETITSHETELMNFSDLFEAIKKQRNWIIAHLDRKFVNNPEKISSITAIDFPDVEHAYRFFISAISTYRRFFDDSGYFFHAFEEKIPDDIQYIFGLIEIDNENAHRIYSGFSHENRSS